MLQPNAAVVQVVQADGIDSLWCQYIDKGWVSVII